jgi:hypothetical protein
MPKICLLWLVFCTEIMFKVCANISVQYVVNGWFIVQANVHFVSCFVTLKRVTS